MRSLLQFALTLVVSTNLVACVTDDDQSIEDQLAEENDIGFQDESMKSELVGDSHDVTLHTTATNAALAGENGAQLHVGPLKESGATLHDGTSPVANRDGAVTTTGGVVTSQSVNSRAGNHVAPGSIDETPSFRLPGRRDGSTRR